jgi:hypothetical protein
MGESASEAVSNVALVITTNDTKIRHQSLRGASRKT